MATQEANQEVKITPAVQRAVLEVDEKHCRCGEASISSVHNLSLLYQCDQHTHAIFIGLLAPGRSPQQSS